MNSSITIYLAQKSVCHNIHTLRLNKLHFTFSSLRKCLTINCSIDLIVQVTAGRFITFLVKYNSL